MCVVVYSRSDLSVYLFITDSNMCMYLYTPSLQHLRPLTAQLLLNLLHHNLPHALPPGTSGDIRDSPLLLLKTNKLLRQHAGEIEILLPERYLHCTSKLRRMRGS